MTHLVHLEIHPALCISRVSRAAVDADGLAEVIEARPLRPFRVVAESTYLNSGLGTTASREWSESSDAPQNEFARLRAARVRTEDGRVTQKADIRQPLYLEVEYQVLKGGHALLPAFGVYNEEGACVFLTHENDPAWRSRERPVGYYVSTAIIPGNYLSEGGYIVGVAISQHIPSVELHVHFGDALAFQVIDCMDADSVRGDYGGTLPGVIRPRLKWETQFTPRP